MFDESLELSDVLARLQRADESLAEFVTPLWPGVSLAAAWIEGKARLFRLDNVPAEEGYYLLRIENETAVLARPAEDEEIRKFLGYLTKAGVILLDNGMAFPRGSVERLQGITSPHPIHFAQGEPLAQVQARFDGLNLLFAGAATVRRSDNPLEALFSDPALAIGDDLLDIHDEQAAGADAAQALERLHENADLYTEYRLRSVLEAAGAVLEDWNRNDDGYHVRWRLGDETHAVTLAADNSPITSGISLAGARAFDPTTLIRLLHQHILDAWR
jgi:hypothetical protein